MKLSNKNIDAAIATVEKFFDAVKVPKKDKLKLCLILEESLLRYQEKFGEDYEFKFFVRKWFGTPKILIKIKGTPYNPLEDDSEENIFSANVMQNLLNYEQAGVVYSYENGCNEINAFAAKEIKKLKIPGGSVTISILLAIFTALLADNFSEPTQKIIIESFVTPLLNSLFGAIIAVNTPLIFISIVASISAIENVTVLHELGAKTLKRFLAILIFIAVVSILVCSIFFPVINFDFQGQFLQGNSIELQKIFALILSIIPQNIIEPFYDGKVLQIVFMALLTGICITILGDRISEIKKLIINAQQIIFELVQIIFKIIPAIIFLCIFKTILLYSISEILSVWKVIAAEYVLFIFVSLIMLLKISIQHGVKISDFLKKIYPAVLISFTTGSGAAAMPKNIDICKKELKMSPLLCDFYIPLSHALCPATMLIGFVTCAFFAAEFSGAQITIPQLFIIVFLSIQLAISASSGSGGTLAMLGLLLTQLEFSLDAIGTMMIADIFVVNASGIAALIIRDCDLYDFAQKVN